MDKYLPHPELIQRIRRLASLKNEAQQVSNRLLHLLPQRLHEIKAHLRPQLSGGAAERHALTNQQYLDTVQELVEIKTTAQKYRIEYETYSMLFKARQSQNSFNRRLIQHNAARKR